MDSSTAANGPALYNSRIIDTYLKLLARKYPRVEVPALLNYAGMEPYEVADQGHWFTQEQVDRFHEKIVQLTGNEQISREAGRYAASAESLGAMRQFILAMATPGQALILLATGAGHMTRSTSYKARLISPNKAEVLAIPHPGTLRSPFNVPIAWGSSRPYS
ncbi:hypothetical protein [Desulfuromonas versatilis]|nr:hypothetical protein [Desulfuromonas versatilis]